MEDLKEKIENQKKAITLFQYLIDNYDNLPEISNELKKEILSCKNIIFESKKAKSEVFLDLKNKTITHNKHSKELETRQEYLLLEELVNKPEVHWTIGYILFRNWQSGIETPPVKKFRRPVHDINYLFKNVEIVEAFKRGKDRLWKLNEDIRLKSQVEDVSIILDSIDKDDSYDKAINKCQEALKLYPDSYKANKKILDILYELKEQKDEWNGSIINAVGMLKGKVDNLEAGYNEILDKGIKNNWEGDWGEAVPYLWRIKEELWEARHYHALAENLLHNTKLDEDKEKLLTLIDSIRDIHKTYQVEASRETTKILKENIFNNFIKEEVIWRSVKNAASDFKNWAMMNNLIKRIDDDELVLIADTFLLQAILDFPRALKEGNFTSTAHLSKYLRVTIYNRLVTWFVIEGGVPENKVEDVLALMRVIKNIERKGSPTNEDILEEVNKEKGRSKWGKEKLHEMLAYIEKLGGFRDVATLYQEQKKHQNYYEEGVHTQDGYYDGKHNYD